MRYLHGFRSGALPEQCVTGPADVRQADATGGTLGVGSGGKPAAPDYARLNARPLATQIAADVARSAAHLRLHGKINDYGRSQPWRAGGAPLKL